MVDKRILFLALGEEEVQAYRFIADLARARGYECRVVTWLPRLAGGGVESLFHGGANRAGAQVDRLATEADFAYPGQVADFDRDWHFASSKAKARHGRSILSVADKILRGWNPDYLVSAVGGESARVAFEGLSRARNIDRIYYNAIPLESRYVLLSSLSAPFVPVGGSPSYMPSKLDFQDIANITFVNNVQHDRIEWLSRIRQMYLESRGIYPNSWLTRQATTAVSNRVLAKIRTSSTKPDSRHINVLYPMHDERDFQVAVRERHAVPQEFLLKYVASMLAPGYKLWIKPHPQHARSHHTRVLRAINDIPNIGFLDPQTSFEEAIDVCDIVFTLASTLGFEALKRAKPVVCYGKPFYGGRGLTEDVSDPRLIAAALEKSVNSVPDPVLLDGLLAQMRESSWPGRFTPIDLTAGNLVGLAEGVFDVIEAG